MIVLRLGVVSCAQSILSSQHDSKSIEYLSIIAVKLFELHLDEKSIERVLIFLVNENPRA